MPRDRNSNFVFLTGLWETKKRGLFVGRVQKDYLLELLDKVDDESVDEAVFFLRENDDKRGRKDPDFKLSGAPQQEQSDRGRDRGRGRGRDIEDRNDRDDRD